MYKLAATYDPTFREISFYCRQLADDGLYGEPTLAGFPERLDGTAIIELTWAFSVGCEGLIEASDDRLYAESFRLYLVPHQLATVEANPWLGQHYNLSHYDGVPEGYQLFRSK